MFKDYENLDTTKGYVHVVGWRMTIEEFARFMPALTKKIKPFLKDVSFFYMPSHPSELTGHVGARFTILCKPDVHAEVYAAVELTNF